MGNKISEDAQVTFLLSAFQESIGMLRHYDNQIIKITSFAVSCFFILISAEWIIYNQFHVLYPDIVYLFMASLLLFGTLIGMFLSYFMVRNRVYFGYVARNVNEIRSFFLTSKIEGYENVSGMWTEYREFPFYNPASSQMALLKLVLLKTSIAFGASVGFVLIQYGVNTALSISGATLLIIISIITGIRWSKKHLEGKSKESPDKGTFK